MLENDRRFCGCSLQTGATAIVVFDVIWNIVFCSLLAITNGKYFDIVALCLVLIELCIAPIAFIGVRTEISLAILPFLMLESFRVICLGSIIILYPTLNIPLQLIHFIAFFIVDLCLFVVMCYCFKEIREKNYCREAVVIHEAVHSGRRKISRLGSSLNMDMFTPPRAYDNLS